MLQVSVTGVPALTDIAEAAKVLMVGGLPAGAVAVATALALPHWPLPVTAIEHPTLAKTESMTMLSKRMAVSESDDCSCS